MKSSDGKEKYLEDLSLKNLFWICLTNQSHMRSFTGSDKRFYRNELCLDTSNGDTLASLKLKTMIFTEQEGI